MDSLSLDVVLEKIIGADYQVQYNNNGGEDGNSGIWKTYTGWVSFTEGYFWVRDFSDPANMRLIMSQGNGSPLT